MRKYVIFASSILLVVVLSGCMLSQEYELPELPPNPSEITATVLPNGESIILIAPDGWNSFRVGDSIYLMVQNLSDEPIEFEQDLGVEIYILQENKWLNIDNNAIYPDTNKIILEPNETFDPLKVHTLFLLPEITNTSDIVMVRIYVFGNEYIDEKIENQQIATYIDLQLNR